MATRDTSIESFTQLNAAKRDEQTRARSGHAFKLVRIYTDKIVPNPRNPRQVDAATLTSDPEFLDLVESVRVHGVLQPILVRLQPSAGGETGYELVAGERRWRAAMSVGLESVPAVVSTYDDSQAQIAALVENLQRQDIRPIDEARGFRQAMDSFKLSETRLGELIGKSRSYVNNRLRLLQCSSDLVAELDASDSPVSAQHVLLLQGIDEAIRPVFLAEVKRTGAGYNRMLERKKVWDEWTAAHAELLLDDGATAVRESAARLAAQGLSLAEIEQRLQGRKPAAKLAIDAKALPDGRPMPTVPLNDLETIRLVSETIAGKDSEPSVALPPLLKALEADLRRVRKALRAAQSR